MAVLLALIFITVTALWMSATLWVLERVQVWIWDHIPGQLWGTAASFAVILPSIAILLIGVCAMALLLLHAAGWHHGS